jgi:hypothetical protein
MIRSSPLRSAWGSATTAGALAKGKERGDGGAPTTGRRLVRHPATLGVRRKTAAIEGDDAVGWREGSKDVVDVTGK